MFLCFYGKYGRIKIDPRKQVCTTYERHPQEGWPRNLIKSAIQTNGEFFTEFFIIFL